MGLPTDLSLNANPAVHLNLEKYEALATQGKNFTEAHAEALAHFTSLDKRAAELARSIFQILANQNHGDTRSDLLRFAAYTEPRIKESATRILQNIPPPSELSNALSVAFKSFVLGGALTGLCAFLYLERNNLRALEAIA
jgi:hypothetical protein